MKSVLLIAILLLTPIVAFANPVVIDGQSLMAFGMVAFSKRLDVLARAAAAKAVRQDQQEVPQRLKQKAEESRIALEKARISNKTTFRP